MAEVDVDDVLGGFFTDEEMDAEDQIGDDGDDDNQEDDENDDANNEENVAAEAGSAASLPQDVAEPEEVATSTSYAVV